MVMFENTDNCLHFLHSNAVESTMRQESHRQPAFDVSTLSTEVNKSKNVKDGGLGEGGVVAI